MTSIESVLATQFIQESISKIKIKKGNIGSHDTKHHQHKKRGGREGKKGLLQAMLTKESSPLKSSNNHQEKKKLETIASGEDKNYLICQVLQCSPCWRILEGGK